jgi:hypothetical protein
MSNCRPESAEASSSRWLWSAGRHRHVHTNARECPLSLSRPSHAVPADLFRRACPDTVTESKEAQ